MGSAPDFFRAKFWQPAQIATVRRRGYRRTGADFGWGGECLARFAGFSQMRARAASEHPETGLLTKGIHYRCDLWQQGCPLSLEAKRRGRRMSEPKGDCGSPSIRLVHEHRVGMDSIASAMAVSPGSGRMRAHWRTRITGCILAAS